jgi:hypothetical protein
MMTKAFVDAQINMREHRPPDDPPSADKQRGERRV